MHIHITSNVLCLDMPNSLVQLLKPGNNRFAVGLSLESSKAGTSRSSSNEQFKYEFLNQMRLLEGKINLTTCRYLHSVTSFLHFLQLSYGD
uniref:Uncharacterized protein n=1 Tax=Rhizophora mucronata TaxID=61149 RepID=A0A2P2PTX2_RHIMU